ncbi:MAG: carboxypeptidase-like regulatory domain-containing protein, partial [Acidobacteria bacterium]|nr:carboxypeptidase-like regulatory domain-containing protein [Acidobacteriota bacterium]
MSTVDLEGKIMNASFSLSHKCAEAAAFGEGKLRRQFRRKAAWLGFSQAAVAEIKLPPQAGYGFLQELWVSSGSNGMRMRSQFLLVVLCLLIAAQGAALYAQMGRASITGIVSDSSGAIVPGVAVTATQTGTQVTTETTTNDVGNYTISALPIGQYSISFTKPGFKIHSRTGLDLGSGQVARIDVTLDVGEVSDQVTVTGEASLLQTESAQASKGVTASVFARLPLNFSGSRNMQKFADKLVPGVNGDIWRVKIQGTPGGTQNVVIDGTTNTAGMLPGDFAEASISPEAIQE